jgi:hypothetical protein
MRIAPVPPAYVGLWKRTLLETRSTRDSTARVFWLQTHSWHADIRVPVDRPALPGHTSLDQLSDDQLLALAGQQGFAGITEVDGDLCRWHRKLDYQPPSGFDDIGQMRFETPDRALEAGVEQEYFEVWERVPSSGDNWVRHMEDPDGTRTVLLGVEPWFMFVRPRRATLTGPEGLKALVASTGGGVRSRELLDFEISLGRRGGDGSRRIELSTLPWREGQILTT